MANFWVNIRDNGSIVKSWVEYGLDWESVDAYEEELKAKNPGLQVEIGEYEG